MQSRREFLKATAAASVMGLTGCATDQTNIGGTTGMPARILMGACAGINAKSVGLLKAAKFDFFEADVASSFMPEKDDEAWKRQRDLIKSMPLPLRSCNGFLPGKFRLTGPNASFEEPLKYAERACRRADEVGLNDIVFGSGGARNIPKEFPDFPKEKAIEQFTEFCKQLTKRISDCHVVVVLEPLCPKEANYLNLVTEGLDIIREVNSPRLQQLADFYHMSESHEGPEAIIKAGRALRHCHIATPGTRMAPGCDYEGPIPDYFRALYKIGYRDGVSIEAGWPRFKNEAERLNAYRKARSLMFDRWAGQCYG